MFTKTYNTGTTWKSSQVPVLGSIISHVLSRASAWLYLFDGPRLIQEGYDKSNGGPFEILAPDNRYVFVSSPKQVKELDAAPDTVLSLQGASKQMLQPMYTMHGFDWFNRRGTEGVGFVRALRTLLTNNVPQILPDLGSIIRTRFQEQHATHSVVNGTRLSPVYPMIVKLVVLSNAVSFFGKSLTNNEAFMESALQYVEETLLCAEVVRLSPQWMASIIGTFISRRLKSHEVVFDTLLTIAEQRCLERDMKNLGHSVPDHADCIQWIMETAPRKAPWTPKRIVHELMAIWFGSVHAMATTTTFAIQDLCLHPEYVEPLRVELEQGYEDFQRTNSGLPLLDSFIKESARLTPVESQSMRRCALQPFSLSDGTKVAVGEWACTPVRAIMQSPEFYPSPMQFHGFRFAPKAETPVVSNDNLNFRQPSPSKLTDIREDWHVWGVGRMACPGRFYATAIMKMIIGQIVLDYDCELQEPEAPRWFTWRSSMLPKASTMVVFKPVQRGPDST
ncbi:hypothetical protein E8E14_002268 [Neopestalotiopsis sp. 37M]|nr:hypothetical protein E8E14_002268 [Neopestalotiopsis sp. 37M]